MEKNKLIAGVLEIGAGLLVLLFVSMPIGAGLIGIGIATLIKKPKEQKE